MDAEKNNETAERNNFEDRSTQTVISEILKLVEKQMELLKAHTAISQEAAAAYQARAWKIRELFELLEKQRPHL